MCHMKGDEISITFLKKTWHQGCPVFILLAFKKAIKKLAFYNRYLRKNFTCHIKRAMLLHRKVST